MNELVFDCHEAAIYAAMILLMYGHYVVMLSREERCGLHEPGGL